VVRLSPYKMVGAGLLLPWVAHYALWRKGVIPLPVAGK
jgi:hypothetical protein